MISPADKIRDIRKGAKVRGRGELIAHHEGEKLSHRERVWAFCYDCTGYHADSGKKTQPYDCQCHDCPLYPIFSQDVLGVRGSQVSIKASPKIHPIKSPSVRQKKRDLVGQKIKDNIPDAQASLIGVVS